MIYQPSDPWRRYDVNGFEFGMMMLCHEIWMQSEGDAFWEAAANSGVEVVFDVKREDTP